MAVFCLESSSDSSVIIRFRSLQQEARKEESLKRSKEFREKIRSSTKERNA